MSLDGDVKRELQNITDDGWILINDHNGLNLIILKD